MRTAPTRSTPGGAPWTGLVLTLSVVLLATAAGSPAMASPGARALPSSGSPTAAQTGAAGIERSGSDSAGSEAAGSETAGTESPGSETAEGHTASSESSGSETASAVAAPGPASGGGAAAAAPPRVRSVDLHGVDPAVLRIAPPPPEHAHGSGVPATSDPGAVGQLEADGSAAPPTASSEERATDLTAAVAATVGTAEHPAALVAVSADTSFAAGTAIQVRVEQSDGWSDWQALSAEDGHGPDPGSAQARGIRVGSEPLLTAGATRVQVRIDTPDGRAPAGTALEVISAPTSPADSAVAPGGTASSAPGASAHVTSPSGQVAHAATVSRAATIPRPPIFTRAQWGADESWRSRGPVYTGAVRAGFLHHTASTSDYTPEQTPARIRAIYAYHTKALGHSDIDYNFVVDRFGRLWEGRYGGMDRSVLGGHTAGFNANTFAIVALGNFQSTAPSANSLARMKDSIARLFAWKLGLSRVSPVSTARLVSAGFVRPTRYPRGTVAQIPTISSHQTVNFTSCPGSYLQRELPAIRALAARYAHVVIAPPAPATSTVQFGSGAAAALTARADRAVRWRAEVLSPCTMKPIRSFSGRIAAAGPISVRWDLLDADGVAALPAAYTVRVTGTAADGSPVLPVAATVVITPAPGGLWGPCSNMARVAGSDAAATSVHWGRIFAPSSRTVVLTAPATQSDAALAAGVVAGPLARHLRSPLLLTRPEALSAAVAADLRARRATQVLVVGSTAVVPAGVLRAVQRLGIPVTRLAGETPAETAAVVARQFPAQQPAVLVSPGSAPAHALAGSALAATRDAPVLLSDETAIPRVTRQALATRRSVTVAMPVTLRDQSVRDALAPGATWVRLAGADEVAASTKIGAAASRTVTRVVVLPATRSAWAAASLAAASAAPLLFTGGTTLPATVRAYLDSRDALRAGLTPVSRTQLTDTVLGAAGRLLAGAPWSPRVSATYRLTRANATPEPVRRGAVLAVRAGVRVSDGIGTWGKAPVGTVVTLQHRAAGAAGYRAVASVRITTAGTVRATAKVATTGRWRFVVSGTASKSDRVRVRP